MKKWCALLLAFAMVLTLTACQSNPDTTVVAQVGNATVTKTQALTAYDFVLKQLVYYYAAYYGVEYTEDDKDFVSSVKNSTLNVLAEQLALELKLEEFGIPLTEDDLAEIEATAVETYGLMIEDYVNNNGVTEEYAIQVADGQGYTLDYLRYAIRCDIVAQKLREVALTDIAVTENEVVAEYDRLVAEKTETYSSTPSQYGSDILDGSTIYVRPEGYRYVKNLVVGLPDDIQSQIDEKNDELYMVWYYEYMLSYELAYSELDEETKASYEEQIALYDEEYQALEAEIAVLTQQGLEQIRTKAEEILALCTAEGADFDALLAEYGSDTVTNELVLANGYPVCANSTSYVTSFTEAAMALEQIGDISDLVETEYGFHILLYTGDIEPGVVPMETLRDDIYQALLIEKQDEAYSALETEWINGTSIKTYISRF